MDWDLILSVSLTAAVGSDGGRVRAWPPSGLNVHFGYTGLLNFGQVGFVAVGAYAVAIGVDTYGLSFWLCLFLVARRRVGARPPARRARRCGCGPTTSPSSPSPPARSSASCCAPPRFRDTTGGAAGIQDFAGDFFDLNPFDRGDVRLDIPGTSIGVEYNAGQTWVLLVGWVARRARRACSSTCSCAARGAGCSRPSARTRTPSAASARTSTRYKMQSLVLGGVIGALRRRHLRRRPPVGRARQPRHRAHLLRLRGPRARRRGPGARARCSARWSSSSSTAFADVALRQAIEADHINFLVANEVGIVRQMLVGVGLMRAHDLPTAGHPRRQAGGGGQCPPLRPTLADGAAFAGVAPEPGRGQARPDPRRRRRAPPLRRPHRRRRRPPRGAAGRHHRPHRARTAPARRRSSTCSPASTSPTSGRWTLRRRATSAGVAAHKVARRGMVRTFQLTKSLARLSVLENMKLGATGQRGEGFFAGLVRPLWSAPGARRSRPGPRSCSSGSSSTTCATSSPARCRAASASCSRWRGR